MGDLFRWWFSPKRSYSIIRISIGIIIVFLFIIGFIGNLADFIGAFHTEPLFTGMFLLLLPIFLFVFLPTPFLEADCFISPIMFLKKIKKGGKSY